MQELRRTQEVNYVTADDAYCNRRFCVAASTKHRKIHRTALRDAPNPRFENEAGMFFSFIKIKLVAHAPIPGWEREETRKLELETGNLGLETGSWRQAGGHEENRRAKLKYDERSRNVLWNQQKDKDTFPIPVLQKLEARKWKMEIEEQNCQE